MWIKEKIMSTIYPKIIDDLLVNPNIGFIAAPQLMGEHTKIKDSRGNEVEPYKFTEKSKTYNHPDSAVWYCGARWKDLQPQENEYNFESLDDKLEKAKAMGCTAVVRVAPYALAEDEDIPDWLRAKYPEEPEFPFWKIDPLTTEYPTLWAKFITEFAKRYNGHETIAGVDMAIVGAWGEGGGTEFMSRETIETIVCAYTNGFTKTPLHALLHDPLSLEIIRSQRKNIGYRVDCLGDMGGFHGKEWSHMLDFYPENIQNFKMGDAWKTAPIVFEACWHMNDWYLQGWDIDYIIDESLKWHISSYNSKQTTVPKAWQKNVERWVRKMGYRFEIHKFEFDDVCEKELQIRAIVNNSGVAPCYFNYPLIIRLANDTQTYDIKLKEDISKWLPDEDHLICEKLKLPKNINAGKYNLSVGIQAFNRTMLELAIEGKTDSGFYHMGFLTVKK